MVVTGFFAQCNLLCFVPSLVYSARKVTHMFTSIRLGLVQTVAAKNIQISNTFLTKKDCVFII